MTFSEAQTLAKEYQFLIGRKAKYFETTIIAVTIDENAEAGYKPYAFYYREGSHPGYDVVEWYADLKPLYSEKKRVFKIYIPGELPLGIISYDDKITNAAPAASWMMGKKLQEVKPFLIEKSADVIEEKY